MFKMSFFPVKSIYFHTPYPCMMTGHTFSTIGRLTIPVCRQVIYTVVLFLIIFEQTVCENECLYTRVIRAIQHSNSRSR